MLSDGEFVVNAKSTKRHRAMLEAINSGKTVVLAAGGIVNGSTFAPSNTYAPSLAINVTGSGNRNDHLLADRIAGAVDRALKANQPDSFKRTEGQKMGDLANRRRRDGDVTRELFCRSCAENFVDPVFFRLLLSLQFRNLSLFLLDNR